MIATISKDFAFSASHQLEGLPPEHQCSRLHGHNYIFRIIITGEVVAPGFVVDYAELSPIKDWIDDTLDHRHLNDVFEFNPTAEHMAGNTADRVAQLLADAGYENIRDIQVSVSETPKTWATAHAQPAFVPGAGKQEYNGNWWQG